MPPARRDVSRTNRAGQPARRAGARPAAAASARTRPDGVEALARWENEGGAPGARRPPAPPAAAR
jgi:hypothetical protein